jgi:hypothetical protein
MLYSQRKGCSSAKLLASFIIVDEKKKGKKE